MVEADTPAEVVGEGRSTPPPRLSATSSLLPLALWLPLLHLSQGHWPMAWSEGWEGPQPSQVSLPQPLLLVPWSDQEPAS